MDSAEGDNVRRQRARNLSIDDLARARGKPSMAEMNLPELMAHLNTEVRRIHQREQVKSRIKREKKESSIEERKRRLPHILQRQGSKLSAFMRKNES